MSGKADAATSTDDIKGRPLCLFYFTHPFGVLSPDPPTIAAAPTEITQAFINMEPIPTYNLWGQSPSDDYKTTSSSSTKPPVSYELGSISKKSLNVISYGVSSGATNIRYPSSIDLDSFVRKDSLSSSLFSSDFTEPMWSFPSSSSKKDHQDKRLHLPYTLPPLEMPLKELPSTEQVPAFWEPKKPMQKLSLPPIELPVREKRQRSGKIGGKLETLKSDVCCEVSEGRTLRKRCVSRSGVRKSRRAKKSGLRRMVTCLIQRVIRGRERELRGSPAIQEVLNTIREAWVEPKTLQDRSRTVTTAESGESAAAILEANAAAAMLSRQPLVDALTPRPGASPGLMRRRYSMPETIMRKYRLAQLRSDSEDSEPATAPSRAASPASPARGSCASLCEPPAHRFLRRDRELMRKSALLRRLWGVGRQTGSNGELAPCPSCSCDAYSDRELYDSHTEYGRESRSLDGSRAELRHASGAYSRASRTRDSHPPLAGWATPKRQRLDSPNGLNSSDEMLRTAMRNSYDRAEEHRQEREKREEPPSSDSTFQSHGREASSGEVSRFTETPESAEATQPRKKRRQSVCIYMNSLESPSVEIKSETVTDTTEDTESYSVPQSGEKTATSNSTFVTSEVSTTNPYSETSNAYSDTTSTCYFDSTSASDVKYSDSLEGHTESSNDKSEEPTCIAKVNEPIKGAKPCNGAARTTKTPSRISESTVEILEIVVSETLNSSAFDVKRDTPPAIENNTSTKSTLKVLDIPRATAMKQQVDLDEYVSNILVESLNSLTDQLEGMNASIGGDCKISIVEKEIKVKLQNTGMNTIVHLSPTSNNPIIFGNEELYDKHEMNEVRSAECFEDKSTSDRGTIKIELTGNNDLKLTDSSENVTHVSAKELENDNELSASMMSNENINKTVLQQIQKLFQDGVDQFDSKLHYPGKMVPEISHIEISNVDVFIDDNSDPNYECNDRIEINTDRNSSHFDSSIDTGLKSLTESVLGEVGTGTYFKEPTGPVLVPRFSAFPNTDSMEVNTSSSDDAEAVGSDCTSLVDSLDDPNSPRSIMLRRAYGSRRSELVRSAIDVLDLLPEMSQGGGSKSHVEKSEAFFIRIRDNDCDCEKENVVVADHMPDKIKQRLYRRHRKRELRMEYAKRKKVRQIKRDIDKQRTSENVKSKKEIEKDCTVILKSLIDEVVTKIAEEEHRYMRIKHNSNNGIKKIADNVSTSVNKKPKSNRKSDDLLNLETFKVGKNGDVHFCNSGNIDKERRTRNAKLNGHDQYYKTTDKTMIRGKLSLQPRIPEIRDDYGPKRIYQKSEIHDGSKCIEILEILEYVDSSQSSPETTNSDENQNHRSKHRKSKIPVPIYERIHRIPRSKNIEKSYKNAHLVCSSPDLKYHKFSDKLTNYNMDNIKEYIIADILIDAINDNVDPPSKETLKSQPVPTRRASVPQQEANRGRSNSTLRFKQMFDIIPEEKSSLSVESSNEDVNLNRRVSAPVLAGKYPESNNNETTTRQGKTKTSTGSTNTSMASRLSKSTSTSPSLGEDGSLKMKMKNVMTSPLRKTVSAATSPIIAPTAVEDELPDRSKNGNVKQTSSAKKSLSSHGTKEGWVGFYKPSKQLLEEEGTNNPKEPKFKCDSKSTHTQYDVPTIQSTVRTIENEHNSKQIIINHEKSRASSEKSQTREGKTRVDDARNSISNTKEAKRKEKNKLDFFDRLKDPKSKRELRMVHSLSDPQTGGDFVFKKTDTKKIQMISLEQSEEETIHSKALKLPSFKDKQFEKSGDTSSDSDSDSAKSLLCSLAPKWLSMGSGARQKRQIRKKGSQEQPGHSSAAGGWSVTVAGNCYTALPADVEMRLSFPKAPAHHITSQSDSGFGDDCKSRRPIAAAQKIRESSCKCRHCDDCTCSKVARNSVEQDSSCSPFLPPAQNRKMMLTLKKESSGSSLLASKSLKKQNDSLPELETYKNSKSRTKSSLKSRRRLSLHCWRAADDCSATPRPRQRLTRPRINEDLTVLGCAIIPEIKPRVPTMSERDLTRVYTPRHYLRT